MLSFPFPVSNDSEKRRANLNPSSQSLYYTSLFKSIFNY